jgi:PAS domain S-box-containing protein
MNSVTRDPPSVSSIPAAAQAELFEPSDKPHRDLGALWEAINQHAIVSMADPAGNITYANETFVRISGYSREELLGQNHRVLKSDVHGPEFWDAMWKTISSGYVWKGVVCNCAKDGSHYWVDTQISPSFGPSGQIEQYMSIRTDITAHKRALSELEIAKSLKAATDALQLRRFYMQATLDNLPFQFWLKDAQGRYLAVNQVFADACGYSTADEVTGLTDLELWPSAQAQKYQSIDAEVMGSCLAQTREECDPGGDTRKWLEVFIKPLINGSGEVLGTMGYSHDISARKQVQVQLQQHAEHLDAIFELSPEGFVSFDADHRVNHVSPAFTRMTGITAAQINGLGEAAFAKLLGHACASGCGFGGFEALRNGRSGDAVGRRSRIELALGGKRVLDLSLGEQSGGVVSQILCFRDMTHEVEVERLKTEFLTAAAHELRTPMTAIYGYSEMMLHQRFDEATQIEMASVVHQQAQRVVSLLNDMFDLVRIEERRDRDMDWQGLSLSGVVAAVIAGFKLPTGRAAPAVLPAAAPWRVWGDQAKVMQAVSNVLANAYKYSPAGGPIDIELVPSEATQESVAMVGVRVTDGGIGMTAVQLERVYERFYRADASGRQLGTGLGMSLVKVIVDLHRGRIDLRSQPGAGTTVTLWFPMHRQP